MTLMIISWCKGGKCDPCPTIQLPPPDGNYVWKPPPIPAIQIWYHMIQDHFSNGRLDGGSLLVGIGAEIITPTIDTGFSWNWGPSPAPVDAINGWGGPYIIVGLDYFDHTGPHFAQGSYPTLDAALVVGQAFGNYYFP
jgi:hypothetical protein